MKVGILTITDGANYGNRLQNYAMQVLLEQIGITAITLTRKTKRDLSRMDKFKDDAKQLVKIAIGKKNTSIAYKKRKKRFDTFNEHYIKFSEEVLQKNIAPKGLEDRFDYFICGSDQVWNTKFPIISDDIQNYLASFARPRQKIAYAASFGTDDISPEYKGYFEAQLRTFKAIGVRENSGAEIVKNICNREDVTVVLDPTMMITVDEWMKIAKKPSYIEGEKFVLTYFLGGREKKLSDYIKNICIKYDAEDINLDVEFLTDDKISRTDVFCTSPNEFIWLIANAECVLTDSFHACVFSILFQKPFAVFQRRSNEKGNNMGSRIDTLLGRFDLMRYCGDIQQPDVIPSTYDFLHVKSVLNKERLESLNFLYSSLEVNPIRIGRDV